MCTVVQKYTVLRAVTSRVLCVVQEYTALSRELSQVKDRLIHREEEITELKSERNNTRVSFSLVF